MLSQAFIIVNRSILLEQIPLCIERIEKMRIDLSAEKSIRLQKKKLDISRNWLDRALDRVLSTATYSSYASESVDRLIRYTYVSIQEDLQEILDSLNVDPSIQEVSMSCLLYSQVYKLDTNASNFFDLILEGF